jgi:hypothetical protein
MKDLQPQPMPWWIMISIATILSLIFICCILWGKP